MSLKFSLPLRLDLVVVTVALAFWLHTAVPLGPWEASRTASAQDPFPRPAEPVEDSERALADMKADEALAEPPAEPPADPAGVPGQIGPSENFLSLIVKAGWLMVPIGAMSVLVLALAVERGLALRRSRILPPDLISGFAEMARRRDDFDPRAAYRFCQQYPSTASTVIRSMLFKVGRPHAEVERAVADASEREAARLYKHVRTLNLAAAISPLLGLLGTVWGMIKAFMGTATMPGGANKAEHLAEGIYTALVTTFAGLAVAIPAAILAHIFEGRIQSLLREIDELLFDLLPQVERFEGKLRVSRPAWTGKQPAVTPDEHSSDEPHTASAP